MNRFQKLLNDFEGYLISINSPVLSKLNNGVESWDSKAVIESIPNEVEILYRWKDGTDTKKRGSLGQYWLFNFGIFLSLKEAIKIYNECAKKVEKWDEYKFPLFASGGGEFFLLECNKNKKEYGMIYYHSIGDVDIDFLNTKYDSLESFIKTIHKCYQEGAYTYSSIDELEFDDKMEYKIAKDLNPKSEYWNLIARAIDE